MQLPVDAENLLNNELTLFFFVFHLSFSNEYAEKATKIPFCGMPLPVDAVYLLDTEF